MDFKTSFLTVLKFLKSSSFQRNSKSGSYVSSENVSLHIFEGLYIRFVTVIQYEKSILYTWSTISSLLFFSKALFARITIYIIFIILSVWFHFMKFSLKFVSSGSLPFRLTSEWSSPHGFPSLRLLNFKMISFQSDHKI